MKCVDCIKRAATKFNAWHEIETIIVENDIIKNAVAISDGDSVCIEHLIARNT